MIKPRLYRDKNDPYYRTVSAFQFFEPLAPTSMTERIQHAAEYPNIEYNTITGNYSTSGRNGRLIVQSGWYVVNEGASAHGTVFSEERFNDFFELAHNAPERSETHEDNDMSDNTCDDETCVSVDPSASVGYSTLKSVMKESILSYLGTPQQKVQDILAVDKGNIPSRYAVAIAEDYYATLLKLIDLYEGA